jgi:transcriptional regulator with XRE-family HTH domain
MPDIAGYLERRLKDKGWKPAELVKTSGIDSGHLSKILNRERGVGIDTVVSLANGLGEPVSVFLAGAGYLHQADLNEKIEILNHLVGQLDDYDKDEVIAFAELKLRLMAKRDAIDYLNIALENVPKEKSEEVLKALNHWAESVGARRNR